MRVTDLTKQENVQKQIQKTSERLQSLQTDLSTGQKVNRISDDPIAATVIQDVVTTVSRSEQTSSNLKDNIAWMERNEVELGHLVDILTEAKTLLVSQAGSSGSKESRSIVARELQAIESALMEVANAQEGKLYLFSGTETLTPALKINDIRQPAKVMLADVVQRDIANLLDITDFHANFEGFSSNVYRVRITREGTFGTAMYQISDNDGETWSDEQVLLPNIPINNPDGEADDQVSLKFDNEKGLLNQIFPNAGEVANEAFELTDQGLLFPEGIEFVFLPNPRIQYMGNNQRKEVLIGDGSKIPLNITAENLFLKGGTDSSVNIFDVISAVQKGLEEDDQAAVSERLDDLDAAIDQVLKYQADIGNTMIKLEDARTKISDQVFSNQKRLSEVRDVDLAESLIDLNSAEVNNRMALDTGARLIQPSLLEFLR